MPTGAGREQQSGATASPSYGLHTGTLGAAETLAQSVSAMAPSTSASLTIPLVFALAGNATWLVYLFAMACTLLVGSCINRFARLSASPGSLYSYAAGALPPGFGVVAAWALLIAYLATGASVAGGALYYVSLFSHQFFHWTPPAVVVLGAVCVAAGAIAYRDVKLSAQVMLWIELVSVTLVVVVLAVLLFKTGIHIDSRQFLLANIHPRALGPALVLAMFSFAGFESATTLGSEVRNPLRTIPRAVLQCAAFAGVFFMLCSYAEVLGFRGASSSLSESSSPLHLLASRAGVSALGIGIDLGAMVSMFACVLACLTASARVLLRMSAAGLVPAVLRGTSASHGTPVAATALACAVLFGGTATMVLRGTTAFDVYDLAGSLSVFGFLTAYGLVALAALCAERTRGVRVLLLSAATILVILLIALLDLRSTADAVHARIPLLYLACMGVALAAYLARRGKYRFTRDATHRDPDLRA